MNWLFGSSTKHSAQEGGSSCSASPAELSGGAGKRVDKSKKLLEDKFRKDELYEKARVYNIKGRSTMTKQQLVDAIRLHHSKIGEKIRRRGGK